MSSRHYRIGRDRSVLLLGKFRIYFVLSSIAAVILAPAATESAAPSDAAPRAQTGFSPNSRGSSK